MLVGPGGSRQRLTAILAADVAGYTRLMAADAGATVAALDQAREAAIADARRKAEVYAKASGVQLGRVEWISEDTGSGPQVPTRARAAAAPVPIETGEDTLRVRVTVGFDITR